MNERTKIICLTPIKNEDWILDTFLKATSLWADHIVVADQNSTDTSKEIAQSFEKVIYVKNNGGKYDELSRQELLLREARKISGKKLLIALDADEFFTNVDTTSPSWQTMINAEEGTVFSFNWLHISSDFTKVKKSNFDFPWGAFGFMDDGSKHSGRNIHSPRVPIPEKSINICIKDNWVLHYNLISEERLNSKNRWYMVHETINKQRTNIIFQNHYYNYSDFFNDTSFPFDEGILRAYLDKGIDMYSIRKDKINLEFSDVSEKWKSVDHHWRSLEYYWWDYEVLLKIQEYGAEKFQYIDIWDYDWKGLAKYLNFANLDRFNDPRGFKGRLFTKWVRYSKGRNSFSVKVLNRFVRLFI